MPCSVPAQDPAPAVPPCHVPVAAICEIRPACVRRLLQLARFGSRFRRERLLRLDVTARRREILLEPACAVAFLLQRLAQLRRVCVRRLLQLARFSRRLGRERLLGFDIAACRREILLQPACALALLLQRFVVNLPSLRPRSSSAGPLPLPPWSPAPSGSRRRGAPPQDPAPAARTARAPVAATCRSSASLLSLPFQPGASSLRLRRQCRLGLDVTPRRRKILLQPRGPLALLLQRFLQLRFAAPACLFQPGRFLALSSPAPSGSRHRAAPPQDPAPAARAARAPVAEISAAPPRPLSPPVSVGSLPRCFRRQRRLGLDVTPRRRKILLQPR